MACQLANGMSDRGHCVRVIAVEKTVAPSVPLNEGVEVFYLNSLLWRVFFIGKVLAFNLAYYRVPADIVLAFGEWPNSIAPFSLGAPVVVSERNEKTFINASSLYGVSFTTALMARVAYRQAAAVIAVSNEVAHSVRKAVSVRNGQVVVVPNGLDLAQVDKGSKEPVVDPFFSHTDDVIFLSVGRLHRQKNVGMLLRCFAEVVIGKKCRLGIVGDGPERAYLIHLALELGLERKVKFFGYAQNPLKFMRKADCVVSSSDYEGFSNVLLESIACGTPIVAPNCSGVSHILNGCDPEVGKVYKSSCSLSLVTSLMRQEKKSETVSDACVSRACEFSIDKVVQQYIHTLDKVLASTR